MFLNIIKTLRTLFSSRPLRVNLFHFDSISLFRDLLAKVAKATKDSKFLNVIKALRTSFSSCPSRFNLYSNLKENLCELRVLRVLIFHLFLKLRQDKSIDVLTRDHPAAGFKFKRVHPVELHDQGRVGVQIYSKEDVAA